MTPATRGWGQCKRVGRDAASWFVVGGPVRERNLKVRRVVNKSCSIEQSEPRGLFLLLNSVLPNLTTTEVQAPSQGTLLC